MKLLREPSAKELEELNAKLQNTGFDSIDMRYLEAMRKSLLKLEQEIALAVKRRIEHQRHQQHQQPKQAYELRQGSKSSAWPRLLAVSKTVDMPELLTAYALGLRLFAENRPQELQRKSQLLKEMDLSDKVELHLIGHLQTNKLKIATQHAKLIHSIDSLHLASALSDRLEKEVQKLHEAQQAPGLRGAAEAQQAPDERGAAEAQQVPGVQDVLLEINISGEESKSGFSPLELKEQLPELCRLKHLRLRGLMCMAPQYIDLNEEERSTQLSKIFAHLRELRDELQCVLDEQKAAGKILQKIQLDELSMGMSGDFVPAIEQGATIIRLGRSIFHPPVGI